MESNRNHKIHFHNALIVLQKLGHIFCFEQFEVSPEIDTSFTGNDSEIYDSEICCNPNKLDY